MLSLRPWTERRDAATLQRDRAGVEEAICTAAALELVGRCVIPVLASSGLSVASVAGPSYCDYMSSPRVVRATGTVGEGLDDSPLHRTCVVSSAVSRGCSSEDIFTTAVTPVSVTRGRRDLIPLCRNCHMALHRVLEFDRSWRRLDRAQATDLIVKALRRKALASRWVSQETLNRTKEGCR